MKKKLWLLCISAVAVICCLAVILFVGQPNYQDVIEPAKIVSYEDADAVIDDSVLIVRVKKTDETPVAYSLGDNHQDCFTLSKVEVEEVFKNLSNPSISEGSEIDILESQWTDEENEIVHHTGGYLKMQLGKQYLLLLGYNPSVNNYYPLGLLYGKIPIDPEEPLFLAEGYEQVKETIAVLRQRYCP